MRIRILSFLLLCIVFACQEDPSKLDKQLELFEADKTFPKVQNIDELEQTIFLPTLEHKLEKEKNQIYAASLLMAWDTLKVTLGEVSNIESALLEEINRSESFKGVLEKEEYISKIEFTSDRRLIRASAYFKKTLAFKEPLLSWEDYLSFKGEPVPSFGFFGDCDFSQISYYQNDQNFAIKLFPKNETDEIILIKSDQLDVNTLKELVEIWRAREKAFHSKHDAINDWMYNYNEKDEVQIPKLAFHLKKHYKEIIGTTIQFNNGDNYQMTVFFQQMAFVLNEKGAILESESVIDSHDHIEVRELKPKKLHFDGPFYVLLKRKDQQYPYFMAHISNHELIHDYELETKASAASE